MNTTKLALLAATGIFAGSLSAQNNNFLNRTLHYEATWAGYVFGGNIANGGDVLDTIAAAELTDFGIDNVAAPNMQVLTGLSFVLQDSESATSHLFSLVGYTEDVANPGMPDLLNPVYNAGPFASPTTTAGGGAAWTFTYSFTTPIQAPREQNLYIGFNMPVGTATDLLLMQYIDDDITNNGGVGGALIYSQPGQSYAAVYPGPNPGTTPITSHLLGVDSVALTPTFAQNPGSMAIDLEVQGPGGHALTLSNETENPAVTAPASFVTTPHTAFYPDAVDFNLASPPRTDSLGYVYQDNAFVAGDVVAFLVSLRLNPLNEVAFGGPFPLFNIQPGSTGNVCTNLAWNASLAVFLSPTTTGTGTPNELYFESALPLNSAAVYQGLQFNVQGLTLSVSTGTVRGGPCSVQTF